MSEDNKVVTDNDNKSLDKTDDNWDIIGKLGIN